MLTNRTLLGFLRQTPLKTATLLPLPPAPSSRIILRNPTLLRHHQLQQRALSSWKSSRPARFSPLSRWRTSAFQRTRNVRWNSDKPPTQTPVPNGNQAPQSLSARFRELSRRYGYAAVGVYLGLSVLDFPFCFLTVRLVGPARIGEVEHAIVDAFWSIVGVVIPSMRPEERTEDEVVGEAAATDMQSSNGNGNGNGHKHGDNASIWTQLLLAYGVHKSLIFFRVPLTAAVTPKVVKTLRSWGWNIGRPAKRVKSSSS